MINKKRGLMCNKQTGDKCARPTTRGILPTFATCVFAPACIATRHTPCSEMARAARCVAGRPLREALQPHARLARFAQHQADRRFRESEKMVPGYPVKRLV